MQPQDQYATLLQICKENSQDLFNSNGNLPHGGRQPRCSDLELMALSLLQESLNMASGLFMQEPLEMNLILESRKRLISDKCSSVCLTAPELEKARFGLVMFLMSRDECRFWTRLFGAGTHVFWFQGVFSEMELQTRVMWSNISFLQRVRKNAKGKSD